MRYKNIKGQNNFSIFCDIVLWIQYKRSSRNIPTSVSFDAKSTPTAAEGEPEGDHGGAAVEEDEGLQEGRGHLRKLSGGGTRRRGNTQTNCTVYMYTYFCNAVIQNWTLIDCLRATLYVKMKGEMSDPQQFCLLFAWKKIL